MMKVFGLFFVLVSALFITACDGGPQKPKIKNPLAGHAEALEKAKALEKQMQDAFKKKMETIDGI